MTYVGRESRVAGTDAIGKKDLAKIPQVRQAVIDEVLAHEETAAASYNGGRLEYGDVDAQPVSLEAHLELMAVRDAIRAVKDKQKKAQVAW